jgi:site-specific DNA-methyltransferase (adenine-specific)
MIIEGDCLEELKKLSGESVDLVIIDPPYNIGKDHWDSLGHTKKGYRPKEYTGPDYFVWMGQVFSELDRVLKKSGSFWVFHNDFRAMSRFLSEIESNTNLEFRQFVVWNKLFSGAKQEGYLMGYLQPDGLNNFQKMAEYMLFCTKKDLHLALRKERLARGITSSEIGVQIPSKNGNATGWYSNIETGKNLPTEKTIIPIQEMLGIGIADLVPTFNNQKTHHSVWNYDFDNTKFGHLTPKPVQLLENIIRHCSNAGDIVLDCFAGSGSTGIAAENLGRKYILIEKDPEYIALIHQRVLVRQSKLDI